MTVPVLTMINKGARQLLHGHIITQSIDYNDELVKSKLYFHQLSQISGKSYWKYPRLVMGGRVVPLEIINFSLPSERLIKVYEIEKHRFVTELGEEFLVEFEKEERKQVIKQARVNLTELRGCGEQTVYEIAERIRKKGFKVVKIPNLP